MTAIAGRTLVTGCLLLAWTQLQVPAYAHSLIDPKQPPVSVDTAYPVRDHTVSQVYYSASNRTRPAIWFTFEVQEGETIHFQLGVPYLDRFEEFAPLVALIGPGLTLLTPAAIEYGSLLDAGPAREVVLRQVVPRDPYMMALLFGEGHDRRVFHEEFTGTTSWILVQADVTAPATGRFYLVAFQDAMPPVDGKLWMAIGVKERFGLGELFRFPSIIRHVRRFHELE
jgi:hypothetical protein